MATFLCPHPDCRAKMAVPDRLLGQRVRCPHCRKELMAGAPRENPPGRAAAPPPPAPPVAAPPVVAPPPAPRPAAVEQPAPPAPARGASSPFQAPSLVQAAPAPARASLARGRAAPSSVKAPPSSPPGVVPIVPGRRAEERPGGFGWVLAALAAFLLPVLASAGFIALRWPARQSLADGERYAAVDVGSSGVTYAVFEVFQQPEQGYDYRVLVFDSKTTDLRKGMDRNNTFDPDGLARTTGALRTCYETLTETDKIPPSRVFIVGSGGLMGAIRTRRGLSSDRKRALITQNQNELARAVRKATGKTMDFVDPDEEAEFQLDAVVEPSNRESAVYLDVGTGATRGAYRDPAGRVQKLELTGIGEFTGRARKRPGGVFGSNTARLGDELIRRPFRTQATNHSGFRERSIVYLGGGIVWVVATCTHPQAEVAPPEAGLYVPLTAEDIHSFAADVRRDKDFLKSYQPPVGLSPEEKQKVQEEITRMQGPFPPEKLTAGAEILEALAAAMELEGKTVRFHRYAHVAWLMAYIARHGGLKH